MKYQIADYIVDTLQYRISRDGAVLPVEPKVFDLLVCLIRHRDRVLSREELFQKVWDGREVSDTTLSNHVKSARKILGDNGEQQQTILTIRGRGYQFVAPVQEVPGSPPNALHPPPTAPAVVGDDTRKRRPRWRWPLTLAGALLLGGMLLAAWSHLVPSGPPQLMVLPFRTSAGAPAIWQTAGESISEKTISDLREVDGMETAELAKSEEFRHTRKHDDIREKNPELQYLADGTLDISNSREPAIRVSLDDLFSRKSVWTKNYYYPGHLDDTSPEELASIVAPAISKALQVEILDEEQRALAELERLNEPQPDDPGVWGLYVQGLKHLHQYDQKHLHHAIAYLKEAVERDDAFFAGHLALGEAYRWLLGYYEVPEDYLHLVVASLETASKLRPDSAEALSALGFTYVMAWEWDKAWETLNRARDKRGDHALMHLGFAVYYSALDERELVIRSIDALRRQFDNVEVGDWGNWALFMVDEEAARDWVNTMMKNHDEAGLLFAGAGVGAYIRGDHRKAVTLAEAGATRDDSPVVKLMLAQAYIKDGQIERGRQKLREAESATTYTCWYETAATYALLDEKGKAVENLWKAVRDRSNCLVFLNVDPRFKPIRDDPHYGPEFLKLLNEVGLDEDSRNKYPRDLPNSEVPGNR